MIGVAISTTGDEHRLSLTQASAHAWARLGVDYLVVTVDGDTEAATRVRSVVPPQIPVYRVGQGRATRRGSQGVAVNKNTGLALLMDAGATHLFLCDDDTYPHRREAIEPHLNGILAHSMVCWGRTRLVGAHPGYAAWSWPRGVMLYVQRGVVDRVGGMLEQFGPGGHEHVEWSRRIYQARFTPEPFCSPPEYADASFMKQWHAEDIPRRGERGDLWRRRKAVTTSVRREEGDWEKIELLMKLRDNDTSFVPYYETPNKRGSAELLHLPCQGAGVNT